jgi:hypothetical protein
LGVYPNRRDATPPPPNTTEKDILLVKNILHNKEYDNIMDDINKEKEKEGRRNKETDEVKRNGNNESPAHIVGSTQNMPQNSLQLCI